MEWVTITHPDLPGQSARVTRKAFEDVWRGNGWRSQAAGLPELEPEPEPSEEDD